MAFKIRWMSSSQWQGTETETHDGDDEYETRDEAEAALKKMQMDSGLMQEVHDAAVEAQGVDSWLEISES